MCHMYIYVYLHMYMYAHMYISMRVWVVNSWGFAKFVLQKKDYVDILYLLRFQSQIAKESWV